MARAKGTGSVFERPAGSGNWCYQVDVGFTPSGNRRRVTKTKHPTRKAAEAGLAKTLREYAQHGAPAVTARVTVKTWAEQWLGHYVRQVRPTTYQSSASAVRQHIVPSIGKRHLAALHPGDVRAVHASARRGGNSTSTALRAHAVLVTMLRAARAEGHAVPESVFDVRRPPKGESSRDAIPLDRALALLKVASRDPESASRWAAALLEGLRPGERRGLTWAAIDFDKGTVDISWQLQPIPYEDRAAETFRIPDGYEVRRLVGAQHLVRPKTMRGKRIVPMVPWLQDALGAWRDVAPANPHGLVWADQGRPMSDKADRAAWFTLQAAAGVQCDSDTQPRPYTLYEARHTTATLLMEAGVDARVIQDILGHASIVTSRGYMHVSQDQMRTALGLVAGRLQLG